MPKYHKLSELAPRDIVSRAMVQEQKKGPVFLDLRHKPLKELTRKFPTIVKYLHDHGYDLSKDLIPVTPAAHYLCGGIVTDTKGQTNIKNLFAIGEVACTGLQGANRLASNSLLEAAVMGEHAMDVPLLQQKFMENNISKVEQKMVSSLSVSEKKKLSALRQKIQKIMWKCAGIIRTKKLLELGKKELMKMKKELSMNKNRGIKNSVEKMELQNMTEVGLIIINASLKRKKSLGAHFRLN